MNMLSQGSDYRRISVIEACQLKSNVNNNSSWASCDNYCHMFEEVLKTLRGLDDAKWAMGKGQGLVDDEELGKICA